MPIVMESLGQSTADLPAVFGPLLTAWIVPAIR